MQNILKFLVKRLCRDDWEVTNDNSEVQYKLNVCNTINQQKELTGMGAYVKEYKEIYGLGWIL